MLTTGLFALSTGCHTPGLPRQIRSDDRAWTAFTQIAKALEWSDSDKGNAYFDALNRLALANYRIHGPILIAEQERTHVSRKPVPKVWECDDQVLVAAGDVTGDGKPEFVLGAGWSGPMGGVLAVYDPDLRKIAELEMESIWGIEIADLTNDGAHEILCWEDQHHGSGLWQRQLTVLKHVEGKGLAVVWQGSTYEEACDNLDKHEIRIEQKRGRPARIWTKHVYGQSLDPGDRNGQRELAKSHPNDLSSYLWNPTTLRFETDGANISEPSVRGDRNPVPQP